MSTEPDYTSPNQVAPSDILNAPADDRLSIGEASRLLARHPSSLWRWSTTGVVGRDGVRRYMPIAMLAGRRITSRTHVLRFFDMLTGTPPSSRRYSRSAMEALRQEGVLP